ncbi:poly-gamma-glutamate synthase PgsB [Acidobacteriota bacterium]
MSTEIVVTCAVFLVFVIYLYVEKIWFRRQTESIPLRICVTGTRGKSSVTRLIATVLKDSGYSVLAKTTGSRPAMINPDGTEKEIIRHGRPTILEARKVLKVAKSQGVQTIVLELMGILPESVYVESVRMLKPHILVITNVRHDHMAQMGSTKQEIASCFASAIPKDCAVFVLKDELFPVYHAVAESRNARIIQVPLGSHQSLSDNKVGVSSPFEFTGNIELALAVAEHIGIDRDKAVRTVASAFPDFGSLKVWMMDEDSPEQSWFFVSAFAANDPQSTREILAVDKIKSLLEGRRVIALLNFRRDRGDRTLQWLDALESNAFPELDRIVFLGHHAFTASRRLRNIPKDGVQAWPKCSPGEIIGKLSVQEKKGAVLIGMGNMQGAGKDFVDFWEATGQRYDL